MPHNIYHYTINIGSQNRHETPPAHVREIALGMAEYDSAVVVEDAARPLLHFFGLSMPTRARWSSFLMGWRVSESVRTLDITEARRLLFTFEPKRIIRGQSPIYTAQKELV